MARARSGPTGTISRSGGKQAELCSQYLKKGRQVYIEGRISNRQYEAKDGSGKRYRTEIVAQRVQFLGGRGGGGGGADMMEEPPEMGGGGGGGGMPSPEDEDIPFLRFSQPNGQASEQTTAFRVDAQLSRERAPGSNWR